MKVAQVVVREKGTGTNDVIENPVQCISFEFKEPMKH